MAAEKEPIPSQSPGPIQERFLVMFHLEGKYVEAMDGNDIGLLADIAGVEAEPLQPEIVHAFRDTDVEPPRLHLALVFQSMSEHSAGLSGMITGEGVIRDWYRQPPTPTDTTPLKDIKIKDMRRTAFPAGDRHDIELWWPCMTDKDGTAEMEEVRDDELSVVAFGVEDFDIFFDQPEQ